MRCRITADVLIPAGFSLLSDLKFNTVIISNLDQIGDQAGAKLSLSSYRYNSRAMIFIRKLSPGNSPLILETSFSDQMICSGNYTISLSILLEAMINYRLDNNSNPNALIRSLTIGPLQLMECAK